MPTIMTGEGAVYDQHLNHVGRNNYWKKKMGRQCNTNFHYYMKLSSVRHFWGNPVRCLSPWALTAGSPCKSVTAATEWVGIIPRACIYLHLIPTQRVNLWRVKPEPEAQAETEDFNSLGKWHRKFREMSPGKKYLWNTYGHLKELGGKLWPLTHKHDAWILQL